MDCSVGEGKGVCERCDGSGDEGVGKDCDCADETTGKDE